MLSLALTASSHLGWPGRSAPPLWKFRQDTQTPAILKDLQPGKGRLSQIFALPPVPHMIPNSVTVVGERTVLALSARSVEGDMTHPRHVQAIYGWKNIRISQGPRDLPAGEGHRGPKPSEGPRKARLTHCPDPCHENDFSKGSGGVLTPLTDSVLQQLHHPCQGRNPEGTVGSRTDSGIQKRQWDREWMEPSPSWHRDHCMFTARNEETGLLALQGITYSSTKLPGMTNSNRKDKKKD